MARAGGLSSIASPGRNRRREAVFSGRIET
jgi:hypothetical protein